MRPTFKEFKKKSLLDPEIKAEYDALKQQFSREFRDYQDKLLKDLQDPELAIAYLSESFRDKDYDMFYVAIINIYNAQRIRIENAIKNNPAIGSEYEFNQE